MGATVFLKSRWTWFWGRCWSWGRWRRPGASGALGAVARGSRGFMIGVGYCNRPVYTIIYTATQTSVEVFSTEHASRPGEHDWSSASCPADSARTTPRPAVDPRHRAAQNCQRHRLPDPGARFDPRLSEERAMTSTDIAIIGSGINALVAGAMLAKSGKRVVVFEREGVAGGWNAGPGYLFHWGAEGWVRTGLVLHVKAPPWGCLCAQRAALEVPAQPPRPPRYLPARYPSDACWGLVPWGVGA